MATAVRAEMLLLRETLEGFVSPEVATAVLFQALELSGKSPPRSLEETRAFAEGPLAKAVRAKVRADDATQILAQIDARFARAIEGDAVSIDVDVDDVSFGDGDDGTPTATTQMAVVQMPVPVIVLAGAETFAERLLLCLGEDRVRAVPVAEVAALRRAVFAYTPLFVVVDGVTPTHDDPGALAGALRGLPDSALPVIWGSETTWGQAAVARLESAGVRLITLDRREGIEPLLDLVLARFRGEA